MKKQLYNDIKNRIKAIVNTENNPVFKHFDLWNRQVEFIEQETPFLFPAVFIEFTPNTWETYGDKQQRSDILLNLHIVTRWFAQTADYSPGNDAALQYLDLPDHVLKALQNFSATQSGSFIRTNSTPNHNHVGILDTIETYKCRVFDNSAVAELEAISEFGIKVTDENKVPEPEPDTET